MDRRGVAGVHTDLPSMMIVIVAVGLFMASVGRFVVVTEEVDEWRGLERSARELADRFLTCSVMMDEGVLDPRVANLTTQKEMQGELGWYGCCWDISVNLGNCTYHWACEDGSLSNAGDMFSMQLPIVIYLGPYVPSKVTVVVWYG